MFQEYQISQSDQKIKWQWLKFNLVFGFLFPFILLILAIFDDPFNIFQEAVLSIISELIRHTIAFAICYHCAYKNHGIRLLSFQMAVTLILFVKDISLLLKNPTNELDFVLFTLIVIVISIWGWVLSYRLLKVNKKIQIEILNSSEEYGNAVKHLQSAPNLYELNKSFAENVKKLPRFTPFLHRVYKAQKKQLKQST